MLCGCLPFDEESKTALYEKILACKFPIPKYISSKAADLLKRILTRDVTKRLSIEEILKHPWCNKVNSGSYHASPDLKFSENNLDTETLNIVQKKYNIPIQSLKIMILDNIHNEYTTMYYLLAKKKKRDLTLEEDQGVVDSRKEVRFEATVNPQKVKPLDWSKARKELKEKGRKRSKDKDFLRSENGSKSKSGSKNLSRKGSQVKGIIEKPPLSSKRRNTGKESFQGTGLLSGLNKPPTMNLKDITVEVKEKITFSAKKSLDSKRYKSKERSGSGKGLNSKRFGGFKM